MSEEHNPITVKILDREYHISCPAGEEQALYKSAAELDQRMQEIKQHGKVVATDRLAVMAALNIINELSNTPNNTPAIENISAKLTQLHKKIDDQLDLFEQS